MAPSVEDFKEFTQDEGFWNKIKKYISGRIKNEVEGQVIIKMHPLVSKVPTLVQLLVGFGAANLFFMLYLMVMSIIYIEEAVMYKEILIGSAGSLLLGWAVGSWVAHAVKKRVDNFYFEHIKSSHIDLEKL